MTYPTIHQSVSQIGPQTAEQLAGTPDQHTLPLYINRDNTNTGTLVTYVDFGKIIKHKKFICDLRYLGYSGNRYLRAAGLGGPFPLVFIIK